jgi:hypothetical protein
VGQVAAVVVSTLALVVAVVPTPARAVSDVTDRRPLDDTGRRVGSAPTRRR